MSEVEEFAEAVRLASPYAEVETTLYVVWNTKQNHYFVLARDKRDAPTFLERAGHVVNRKLARFGEANRQSWAGDLTKFFSAVARASTACAQGIVTNSDGFAVMQRTGRIFMPLSAAQ